MTEPKYRLSSEIVKELRKMSNNKFSAMHCAKALYATDGDMQRALIWMENHQGWYI
jgi:translation elongation factor EF-Ts